VYFIHVCIEKETLRNTDEALCYISLSSLEDRRERRLATRRRILRDKWRPFFSG
jgi:hypothetical protein